LQQETAGLQGGGSILSTISKVGSLLANNAGTILNAGKGLYQGGKAWKNTGDPGAFFDAAKSTYGVGRDLYSQYKNGASTQGGGALKIDDLSNKGALGDLSSKIVKPVKFGSSKKSWSDMSNEEKQAITQSRAERKLITRYLYSDSCATLLNSRLNDKLQRGVKIPDKSGLRITPADKYAIKEKIAEITKTLHKKDNPQLYDQYLTQARAWWNSNQPVYGIRPPTLLSLYAKRNFSNLPPTQQLKAAKAGWDNMSESDKSPYQNEYNQLANRFVVAVVPGGNITFQNRPKK